MSDFPRDPQEVPNLDGLTGPLVELTQELRNIDGTTREQNRLLREQNRVSQRRYRWGVIAAGLAVVVVLLVGVSMWSGLLTVRTQGRATQQNQEEIKQLGEVQITEALRRERDVLVHRERKEECLIRPFNEVVEHRINARNNVQIELCDPDETLDKLRPRIDALDQRIKEREALGYG